MGQEGRVWIRYQLDKPHVMPLIAVLGRIHCLDGGIERRVLPRRECLVMVIFLLTVRTAVLVPRAGKHPACQVMDDDGMIDGLAALLLRVDAKLPEPVVLLPGVVGMGHVVVLRRQHLH